MEIRVEQYHFARQQGSVFLLAVVILTVLLFLGSSLIERAQTSVWRAAVEGRSTRSFHLAEGGVHEAVWELSQANRWTTYNGESNTELPGGRFDVTVSPTADARLTDTSVRITSTGYTAGPNGARRFPRTVAVVATRDAPWPFGYALAANSAIDVGNAVVDSYRSTDGPYGGTNVHSKATVAVNTTEFATDKKGVASSGIHVGDNGVLNGDILVGPGCEQPSNATNVTGTHNGSTRALEGPMVFAVPAVPAGAIDLGAVVLDGSATMTLGSGTYRASSLSITGATATLFVTGEVKLYVDGDIYLGGNGIVNEVPGKPRNLKVYGTENCTSVEIKGSSTFYGAVYAPEAAIVGQGSVQSGEIFGSLVGKHVKLEGSKTRFHYDESLSLCVDSQVQIRSWQEL